MKSLLRCFIAFPFLVLVINLSLGQSYPGYNIPLEVRTAYQQGTRSVTGMPGPNYWQNTARYTIKAELLHKESKLSGEEVVVYFNNSPDTLNNIVIRLYQDIYKKGNSRQMPMNEEALTDGVLIRSFSLDGKTIDLDDRRMVRKTGTNMIVGLQSPLNPGDSVTMEISWQFDVSYKRPLRMGNYGNDRFFIAYWYPQVAVYDDIDGWDLVEYAGMVEFYNDFNDFEVEITTTDGFMVWATGELENREEIFSRQVVDRYSKALYSDDIEMIFTVEDCRKGKVLKETDEIKWRFKASHVPDFSFAATRMANWEGSSVVVDEEKDRRVLVDAVYGDSARTFIHTAEQARKSVAYMSKVLPGYPFPYNHMTNFNNGRNGGGMESPMMANNGDPNGLPNASATIFHEIAHTYFPFFMGINERKYAWMDEGWAAFLPIGFMEKYFPDYKYLERRVGTFEGVNGKGIEMRLMDLSYFSGDYAAYRTHAYNRPALAYYYLQDALGDSLFKVGLNAYIEIWNGKHPIPYDFFNSFMYATGQKLDWFFKPWFYDRSNADLAIRKITMDNKIVIENIGGLPLPVVISCEYEDGTIEIYTESTAIWSSGEPAMVFQVDGRKKIRKVTLGSNRIPDINESNNVLRPVYE